MLGELDYGGLRFWLDLLQLLGLIALAVYAHLAQRGKVNQVLIHQLRQQAHDEREALEGRVQNLEKDVQLVRSEKDGMPNHNDLGQIYQRVNGMSEDLQRVSGQMTGVSRQLEIIQEYLIHRGDRS